MARKTITVNLEAYRKLTSVKQEGESFSQTIKRVIVPIDFNRWMASIESDPLSDDAVRAIESVVSQRRNRRRSIAEPTALVEEACHEK